MMLTGPKLKLEPLPSEFALKDFVEDPLVNVDPMEFGNLMFHFHAREHNANTLHTPPRIGPTKTHMRPRTRPSMLARLRETGPMRFATKNARKEPHTCTRKGRNARRSTTNAITPMLSANMRRTLLPIAMRNAIT